MNRHVKHFLIAFPLIVFAAAVLTIVGGPPPSTKPDADASPRIVAHSPALGVILRDLGLADRVVARHAYDLALDPALPVVGDQASLDYETLLTLRPTHVLLQWGERELPERLSRLAGEQGWTVRTFPQLRLGDVVETTREIEDLFEVSADRRLSPVLAGAWARDEADLSRAGRVLMLAGTQPPGAVGPGSFHHEILLALGGSPALTEGAEWRELDAEDVLRLAPDAIVLIRPRSPGAPESDPGWERLASMLGRVADLDIPAVRDRRVALIDDPYALTPSTAMGGFADELRAVLREWSE